MDILDRSEELLCRYFNLINSEKLNIKQAELDKKFMKEIMYIVALGINEYDKIAIQERLNREKYRV